MGHHVFLMNSNKEVGGRCYMTGNHSSYLRRYNIYPTQLNGLKLFKVKNSFKTALTFIESDIPDKLKLEVYKANPDYYYIESKYNTSDLYNSDPFTVYMVISSILRYIDQLDDTLIWDSD